MKSLFLLFLLSTQAFALDVPRIQQETSTWCWLASISMVVKYHGGSPLLGEEDMQCSIVRFLASAGRAPSYQCAVDCFKCPGAAGTSDFTATTLEDYAKDLNAHNNGPKLKTHISNTPSSQYFLGQELKNGPVMAGINWKKPEDGEEPDHLVVITDLTESVVTVNDPADPKLTKPFWTKAGGKEVRAGVYQISYDNLVNGMFWTHTITVRKSK